MTTTPSTGLELTRKLIAFDTINPPGDEATCIDFLRGLLAESGFETKVQEYAPKRTNLIARLPATRAGTNRKPLVFTGHVDTVPLGQAPWSVDPFAGEIKDGKLYGRGTSDMKSGVAAFVVAAKAAAELPVRSSDLVLVITAGEEMGCEGALKLAEAPELLGDCGALVVAEPTDNRPMIGHKGALWMDLVTTGVTAHGSMPDKGVNAVLKACGAIQVLESFDFGVAAHPVMGAPSLNIGRISGGMNMNSVPDRCVVGVDIRTIVGQNNAAVREKLQAALGEEVAIEVVTDMDHVFTPAEDPWMRGCFAICERVQGATPKVETATYFTDGSVLKPAYGNPPTVILGPGPMALAHQTDEYCPVANIEEAVVLYGEIVKTYMSEESA